MRRNVPRGAARARVHPRGPGRELVRRGQGHAHAPREADPHRRALGGAAALADLPHGLERPDPAARLPTAPSPAEVAVKSRFLIYRNRVETETDFLVGKREDLLRRVDGGWRIARRKIILDQSVLLAKNLTFFF